ncbi:ribose 5-phosphate isomerase B [Bacteroidales bacterium MSK.15.36]|nr:ribose 5-phosphate isomerase B [Bacteroidales bacterium MSK.15.36]
MEMKVGIGSDHGGYELKEYIKGFLEEEGIEYIDYGTNSSESVDYPEFGEKVALAVKNGECDRGIVICGTGIGISISCNKVAGIRCALCGDTYSAKMSVEHNNAQVLALGGRVVGKDLALEIVSTWLSARFQGGRHERRVNKISDIETKYML